MFGRNNSPETVWLCHNCHDKITTEQNGISPKARSKNASQIEKDAYEEISIAGLLDTVGTRIKRRALEKLKKTI